MNGIRLSLQKIQHLIDAQFSLWMHGMAPIKDNIEWKKVFGRILGNVLHIYRLKKHGITMIKNLHFQTQLVRLSLVMVMIIREDLILNISKRELS